MRSGSSNTGRPAMTGAGFGRCFGAISTALAVPRNLR
jgi:hypothetical protein